MAGSTQDPLFSAVDYTILLSDQLDEEQAAKLRTLLEENGATYHALLPDGRVNDVAQHSHIISTHVDFPEYNRTLDTHCHVVKSSWVTQSVIKNRISPARQHSPDPALFLSHVVVTFADLPSGDSDAIAAGVIAMGGMYSSPMTKLVTHIVSLSEEHPKVHLVKEKNLDCKVVLPHWFDDCLKLGRTISETPYMFPDPEVLDRISAGSIQPRLLPDMNGAISATAGHPPRLTPPPSSLGTPSTPRKSLNAFVGKSILFSKDLNINDRLAKTLQELVKRGGGRLTQSVEECDTYIGHYRDGMEYVSASQAGKEVANLAWFYNVITRNRWSSPQNKLLHYPVPRYGIAGFQDMKIALSNYTGEARSYLENLVKEAGGEFTRTMKQDNTHLITAHRHSEKCDAAEEWNINIVNHLWLEESYAKCSPQSLTHSRYTHFPPRTNLSEVVGQTPIDMHRVEEVFFKANERTIKDVEYDEINQEEIQTPHPSRGAVKTRPSPRKTVPASSIIPNGVQHKLPVKVHEDERTDQDDEDDTDEGEDVTELTPVPVAHSRKGRLGSEDAKKTPKASNGGLEKENSSPPTTGSRSSKQRALDKLHAAKDDIALFQKEMKQKGGVIHGKKRSSAEAEVDEAERTQDSEREVKTTQGPAKKAKQTSKTVPYLPPVPVRFKMLVSGDERWLADYKQEVEDRKTLRSLGIQLTAVPAECTLLCAPKILRTRKFIAAIANAPEVVSTDYLDYALNHKQLHDSTHFLLADRETEERLGFRLADSLRRAKENAHKLLRGWTIYVTDKVSGGLETFQEIISINGGTPIPYRGRTGVVIPKRRLKFQEDPEAGAESQNQGGDVETDFVYLVSGTEDEEVKMWPTFRKLAEKQGLEARIVKTDWLLGLAMGQKVEWDEKWELKEELVPGYGDRRR